VGVERRIKLHVVMKKNKQTNERNLQEVFGNAFDKTIEENEFE
jgi:hypothetical protein